jgi:hypothetical protein
MPANTNMSHIYDTPKPKPPTPPLSPALLHSSGGSGTGNRIITSGIRTTGHNENRPTAQA